MSGDEQAPPQYPEVSAEDELKAMATVAAAIDSLSLPSARLRVAAWAADRYGLVPARRDRGPHVQPATNETSESMEGSEYSDFAEMFHAAAPRNDRERLLTAGHWLQVRQSEPHLHADNVNEILTPLGERISRVRVVLPALFAGRPALVIRTGKGKGTRSRVTFRLTTAGLAAVDAAIAAGGFGSA